MNARRTGILGGAYDPIHIGHLFIAEAVRAQTGLDRVLFIPMGDPAHRVTHAPAVDRRAMVELAIRGNEQFVLDLTGIEQQGPAYTADTLTSLRGKYPLDDFFFIAGADSLARTRWRHLDRVAAALQRFYVVPRREVSFDEVKPIVESLAPELAARFEPIDLPLVDVSSTLLRARVAAGQPIAYLTPAPVVQYIETRRLYRELIRIEDGE